MRKKKITLALVFLLLFLFCMSGALFAAPTADQFSIIKQAPGVKLYNYNSDYVLEIDLTIAKIKSIHNTPQEPPFIPPDEGGPIEPCTPNRSNIVQPRSIAAHWEDAKSEPNAFATFNFGFFHEYNLSLPLKVGDNVISYGFDLVGDRTGDGDGDPGGVYPGEYMYVRFDNDNDVATIGRINCDIESEVCDEDDSADHWLDSQVLNADEEIVGGYSPEVCKSCGDVTARIFIGIADKNNDGVGELLVFATTGATSVASASYPKEVLINFGADSYSIIQGDGGGSGHLIVEGYDEPLVGKDSSRAIPHAFAVYSGCPLGNLSLLNFEHTVEPIYALPSASPSNPNFQAQFALKNDGDCSIIFDKLSLQMFNSTTGLPVWEMIDPLSKMTKYYENVVIDPGETYEFGEAVSYFNTNNSGIYKVSIQGVIDSISIEFAAYNFVVQEYQEPIGCWYLSDKKPEGFIEGDVPGWDYTGRSFSEKIADCFFRHGGADDLGDACIGGVYPLLYPLNPYLESTEMVHPFTFKLNDGSVSTVYLQDVCHPENGQKTICYKPGADKAYLLEGCLGYLWWEYNSMLGAPTSDEIDDKTMFPSDWDVQDFEVMQTYEYGSMFWDADTGLVRMFNDYGTCELNREGEDIALCMPEEQTAIQIFEKSIFLSEAYAADDVLPSCATLSEETQKDSLPENSDGFVFPVLANTVTDPTINTVNPIGHGWAGNGVGWSDGTLKGHLGQDYYLSTGCSGTEDSAVYAVSNGKVVQVINNPDTWNGWDDAIDHGWGRVIVIKHTSPSGFRTDEATSLTDSPAQDNPKIVYSLYGHLKKDSVLVNVGDTVTKGQKIAEIGKGGVDVSWTCSHLHFELKDSTGYSSKEFAPKNNIQAYCCGGQATEGIGFGYSGTDAYAPNRYIPSNFILKNKALDKALVKEDGASEIYWLQNGILYYVTSLDIISAMEGVQSWGIGNVSSLESLSPYTVSSKTFIKTDGQSTGLLIKLTGTPHIYIVDGGNKVRITSPEAFNNSGYDWNDIIEVSQEVFDMFTTTGDVFSIDPGEGAANDTIRQAFEDAHTSVASILGIATDIVKSASSPITGVTGYYQTFANGSIQYMSDGPYAGQAFVISGELYQKWGELGFSSNILGLPTGNKQTISSSFGSWGVFQPFEGGAIQFNGATPFAVYGDAYQKWQMLDSEDGPLGFPTGDLVEDATSGFGTPGKYQRFEGGSIQIVGENVYTVYGEIYDEWGKNGYAGQTTYEAGDTFENGHVTWAGFPESDRYPCDGGECQNFEGGYIQTDGANAEFVSTTHPENLTATVNPDGSVTLSWQNRINASGINVYRAASPAERIATLSPDITEYIDHTADEGEAYRYYISAYNHTAESPYSSNMSVGPAEVNGTVVDQRTGEPISGATISINGIETLSLADGTYAIAIEAGQYDITCSSDGYQTIVINNVEIGPGQILEINFQLPVSLYGTVFDALTGYELPGVTVETNDGQSTETNILGDYSLGSLDPGTYDITFTHQDYPSLIIENVHVIAGESTELTAELSAPLSGTVTDLSSGQIIFSATVSTNLGQTTQTDNHGQYSFQDLNPGVYTLTVSKTGYQTITIPMVIIMPGETLALDVQLTTPGLLNIVSDDLPAAEASTAYNNRIYISGGSYPYTYTITSGSLPPGMTLDSETGNVYGTPTEAGSYAFCIRVTDLLSAYADRCFTIETTMPLSIESDYTLEGGTEDEYYQCSIAAVGGTKPYTFTVSEGLPLDLFWNNAGNIWSKISKTIDFNQGQLNAYWTTSSAYIRDNQLYLDGSAATSSAQIALDCINGSITFDYEANLACGYGFCGRLSFYIDNVLKKSWRDNARGRITIPVSAGTHVFKWVSTNTSPGSRSWQNSQIDNITFPVEVEGNHYFTVQVEDSAGRTAEKQFTFDVEAALKLNTTKLKNGIVGQVYNHALSVSGGNAPYEWGVYSGTLPKGLHLDSASGVLSGTPQEPFYGTIVISVSDSAWRVTYKDLTIQVCDPLEITTSTLPDALVGGQYSEAVQIQGGIEPYAFSYDGILPDGLYFNTSTGVIAGIATAEEHVNFSITVSDSTYPTSQSATQVLSMTTSSNLTITTSAVLPKTRKGVDITPVVLQAGGGSTPYTWSVVDGYMPSGITLNPETGVLSGMPEDRGDFIFTLQTTDSLGETARKIFHWYILDDLSIVTQEIPNGAINKSFSVALNADGGLLPYYWRIKSGTLPTGLYFDNQNGTISGMPTTRQEYSFTVEVSDSDSPTQAAEKTYTIEILDALFINTQTISNGRIDKAYSETVSASLGTSPYSWRLESGNLPPGLTLTSSSTNAILEGTPTEVGTYTFTLEVSDSDDPEIKTTKEFTIEIYGDVIIETTDLDCAYRGTSYSNTIAVSGGESPYTFQIVDGGLPAGLSLNSITGQISGISNEVSGHSSTFTIRVTDSGNPSGFDEKEFALFVIEELAIVPADIESASQDTYYSQQFEGTGGVPPYQWSISQGSLPDGITFNPDTAMISGTYPGCGVYNFTLSLTDSAPEPITNTKTQAYQLAVICSNDYTIAGHISGPTGVTVSLSGDATAETITNAQGDYQFEHLTNGTYTVMPSMSGAVIQPISQEVAVDGFDVGNVDFSIYSQVQFNTSAYTVSEDVGIVTVEVERTGSSQGEASVSVSIGQGTATRNVDYAMEVSQITFTEGETSKSIIVVVLNDGRLEGDETISIVLGDPAGDIVIGEPGSTVIIIQDEDNGGDVIAADVDGDGEVNLEDLIVTLQIISGDVPFTEVYEGGDINGDGKIGIEEVIFVLRKIAE